MNGLLALLALALFVGIVILVPGEGGAAVLLCLLTGIGFGAVIARSQTDRTFLLQLFVIGLLVRATIGFIIYFFELQSFFGGDALTYDVSGYLMLRSWQGAGASSSVSEGGTLVWGMPYFVAAIYWVTGRNLLAVQFVNAVMGAATAPVIFLCARHIYGNLRVARVAAWFVALFPSLVLWSSQGLKDAPVVFLLAAVMLATLKLGERLSVKFVLVMLGAMLGLLSLRFYIFYLVSAAVGGAFVIGMRQVSAQSLARQFVAVAAIGLALTYLGVLRTASAQLETFGNLEAVQVARSDQSKTSTSGFGQDVDVSTTSGALTVIPLGLVYLLFAPFPWQLANLRQSITLPEMLVWWASFPLLCLGVYFTLRYRLRQALPILLFTALLTMAYSVFQGNVGTAYRQRAQLLVFYFIFVAVGAVLLKERHEDQARLNAAHRDRRQAARQQPLPRKV
ncbi:MAG: glycosyltransferase family 39 protein [Acidobacteriota bacterium]|nr:glycosyltransferase family 39 protein [Acidobacteriota bacterium]